MTRWVHHMIWILGMFAALYGVHAVEQAARQSEQATFNLVGGTMVDWAALFLLGVYLSLPVLRRRLQFHGPLFVFGFLLSALVLLCFPIAVIWGLPAPMGIVTVVWGPLLPVVSGFSLMTSLFGPRPPLGTGEPR